MPDETDSWLEALGVTFKSFDDDSSASDVADATSGDAPESAPGFAAEVSDAEQTVETDITGGPGAPGNSTLVMDDPIGVLQLISSSQNDSSGLKFSVIVVGSEKDALLIAASVSGQSVGTVKISQPSGTITPPHPHGRIQSTMISMSSVPPSFSAGGPRSR